MNASVILPIAFIASLALGGVLVLYGFLSLLLRKRQQSPVPGIAALILALVINSWWIAFVGLAAFKLLVLQEDT
ncbi:MAG: hypothetical protein JNL67_18715 [Planctomycetaceae bacterium]|nr:hypothetical protein [Planctomycetaceae bacterium]